MGYLGMMELITRLIIMQGLLKWKMSVVYGTDGCSRFNETNKLEWMKPADDRTLKRFSGEWWIADCRVKNYPDIIVELRQGHQLPGVQRVVDGKKLKNDGSVFNLTDINYSDEGMYFCTACGKSKEVTGIRIRTDGKPFQKPTIVNKPRKSIEYGAEVKMHCEVDGPYDMDWYKDDVIPSNKQQSLTQRLNNFKRRVTLEIKNFGEEDQGLFICRVRRPLVNWVATDKVRIKMKALMKPIFKGFPKEIVTVGEGENFSKVIVATGSPEPDVYCKQTTKKNTKSLPMNNNSVSITYLRYSRHNGTKFTCNATNVIGFTVKHFWLNVQVKPTIIKDQDKTKTLKSESILNLTCKVDKANPGATIIWTYSAEDEQDNTEWCPIKPEHGIVQDNGKVLSIKNQNSYQGFYRCVVKNSLGEDYFKWRVLDEKRLSGNTSPDEANSNSYKIALAVISVTFALFLLFIIAVLCRSKRRYGGLYIFTFPPALDCFNNLDQSKALQEQSYKPPYLREWNFPKERITLGESV